MDCNDVEKGLRVKTVFELESTRGMCIKQVHLDNRKPDTEGTVLGYVPGHGGDVWWVEHAGEKVAAYCFAEFNPL